MRKLLFLSGILLAACNVWAALKTPAVFSDNMVLQRDILIPVWGWAEPGEKVTVKFKEQEKSATADVAGKWMAHLDPLPASAQPEKLTITGKNDRKEFNNVVVGEVWLCSGQSNMASTFKYLKITNEVEGVDYPQIRLSNAGNWRPCNSANLRYFSCVGYYFGLKLWQELRIPIGLVDVSVGCSSIEAWMPPESFAANEDWKDDLAEAEKMQKVEREYKSYTNDEKERLFIEHCQSKYGGFAKGYLVNGKPVPEKYENIFQHMRAVRSACLYTLAIRPILPFGIRGVIWYQGETNERDNQYARKQQALVETWRKLWGEGDFPFYIVQVAPYKGYDSLPGFWIEQYKAVSKTKNTGIVSTVDISDNENCHPLNKRDVGLRLALLALRDTYGKKDIVASGPVYKSMKIDGDKIIVLFDNIGAGLTTKDGKAPDWFEIAGANGRFFKAQAKINGDTVEVSSPEVKNPQSVRFAWSKIAGPNLRNKEGLPAFPFNTTDPFFQPGQMVILGMVKMTKEAGRTGIGVQFQNQAKTAMSGLVKIKSNWLIGSNSMNYGEVAPGSDKTIFIPIEIKPDAPETFDVEIIISGLDRAFEFSRSLKVKMINVKEGAWTERFKIEKLSAGDPQKPDSDADLSASFALSRAQNTLLINVTVKDDRQGQFTRADMPWQEDCIELFLDLFPLRGAEDMRYPEHYAESTYQIAVSPNRENSQTVYSYKALKGFSVNAKINKTSGGYEADIQILFTDPLKGRGIGFDLAVDDSDDNKCKTQLVWRSTVSNYLDRSQWAILYFD